MDYLALVKSWSPQAKGKFIWPYYGHINIVEYYGPACTFDIVYGDFVGQIQFEAYFAGPKRTDAGTVLQEGRHLENVIMLLIRFTQPES